MTESSERLGSVLRRLPRGASLAKEVDLALRDPAAYVERHKKELRDRGIDRPVRALPRVALIDGLIARSSAAEIDHRELTDRLVSQLRRITPRAKRAALPSVKELEALAPADNGALLKVVGDRLQGAGLTLLAIDLRTDGYPVAILAAPLADALIAASSSIGGRVRPLRGANLAKLRAAAATAEQKLQRHEARQQQRQRNAQAHGSAWAKLIETHGSLASAMFGLRLELAYDETRALVIAAAEEAPRKDRVRAQAVAGLLTDPKRAARDHDPKLIADLLNRLPQRPSTVPGRVACLAVLEDRVKPSVFLRLCHIYPQYHELARRAAPKAARERWRRLAEARIFAKPDTYAGLALLWLGNEQTLTALEAFRRKAAPAAQKRLGKLASLLAEAYGRRVAAAR